MVGIASVVSTLLVYVKKKNMLLVCFKRKLLVCYFSSMFFYLFNLFNN